MVRNRYLKNSRSDLEFDKLRETTDGSTAVNIMDADAAADIRFDPDDSQPTYIGLNETEGAATSAGTWIIYKFTYSGSAVTRIQKVYGVYDDRASLFS